MRFSKKTLADGKKNSNICINYNTFMCNLNQDILQDFPNSTGLINKQSAYICLQ